MKKHEEENRGFAFGAKQRHGEVAPRARLAVNGKKRQGMDRKTWLKKEMEGGIPEPGLRAND